MVQMGISALATSKERMEVFSISPFEPVFGFAEKLYPKPKP
jgi:hypothetical protein